MRPHVLPLRRAIALSCKQRENRGHLLFSRNASILGGKAALHAHRVWGAATFSALELCALNARETNITNTDSSTGERIRLGFFAWCAPPGANSNRWLPLSGPRSL